MVNLERGTFFQADKGGSGSGADVKSGKTLGDQQAEMGSAAGVRPDPITTIPEPFPTVQPGSPDTPSEQNQAAIAALAAKKAA